MSVESQELAWQQEQLADAIADQSAAAADLAAQRVSIEAELERYQSRVAELEDQLAAEEAAAAANDDDDGNGNPDATVPRLAASGLGHRVDPDVSRERAQLVRRLVRRPEARRALHAGIDMIAARGTPVVAVHSGTVHRTGSSIGGYGIVVFHDGSSDWTFYTHFMSEGPLR